MGNELMTLLSEEKYTTTEPQTVSFSILKTMEYAPKNQISTQTNPNPWPWRYLKIPLSCIDSQFAIPDPLVPFGYIYDEKRKALLGIELMTLPVEVQKLST